MRIKKVQLLDFKRFTNLTVDLGNNPKKIIALVGPNGCGKSSIFDAFEEKGKDYKGGSSSVDFLLKSAFTTGVNSYDRSNQIKIDFKEEPDISLNKKSFYIRSSYRFTSRINTNNIRKLPDMIEDGNRPQSSIELDSRMQENYERLIGGFFEDVYDKDKTGKQWAEENTRELNSILNNILDIEVFSLGNPVDGRGKLYFKKGISENFPYELLSSGEKEVIDLVIDLIIKIDLYNQTIICIDEPELHINTSIQRKLIIELEKLIPDTCQLWIATHSVGFIRALTQDLSTKCQIIDMGSSDFDSEILLKPIEINRITMQKLFSTALEDLSGLIAPKEIIYCEGKLESDGDNNEQGLDSLIYNSIFNGNYPDVLFISSGGNNQPRLYSEIGLEVLQKAFLDTKIKYLKDRGGKDKILNDEERQIELEQANKKVLSRREIENYVFAPEILQKYKPDLDINIFREIDWEKDYMKPQYQKIKQALNWYGDINELMKKLGILITPDTNIYKELEEDIIN